MSDSASNMDRKTSAEGRVGGGPAESLSSSSAPPSDVDASPFPPPFVVIVASPAYFVIVDDRRRSNAVGSARRSRRRRYEPILHRFSHSVKVQFGAIPGEQFPRYLSSPQLVVGGRQYPGHERPRRALLSSSLQVQAQPAVRAVFRRRRPESVAIVGGGFRNLDSPR